MATLGQLREYVADNAADMSDGKADRVILRHVNAALMRVFHAHPWSFYRDTAQIALDAAETGSAMTLTSDSKLISVTGEVIHRRYLDEGWLLDVTGEDDLLFSLASIEDNTHATLTTEWIAATSATTAYTWRRHTYPLPELTREVAQIQLSGTKVDVTYVRPDILDRLRFDTPTDEGDPRHYTIRGRYLEVWPTPASTATRQSLQIHYTRNPRRFTSADPDETAVDFDTRYDDLIERALDLEIVTHHQGSTTIDTGLALQTYQERLAVYKSADEGLAVRPRNMTLRTAPSLRQIEKWWAKRGPGGSEV